MGEIKTISEIVQEAVPYYKKKGAAESEHKIVYDSSTETLEPIYFFILDLMNDFGLNTEKLVDNFVSSPGSGHFGEIGQRATVMQQQGTKIFGDINTVVRSIINLVYDLKDFKIRLQSYDDLKSEDKNKSEATRLGLKQIWLDKVDLSARGQGSIHSMSRDLQFVTLRDAFLAVKDEKEADKIDLNDRVKRILKPRIQEFNIWVKQSESELRKRYEIEKAYLKSQVNSLKIYSRWARPYLKTAAQLEMKTGTEKEPALVKIFNTLILELTLFGKSKIKVKESALSGDIPPELAREKYLNTIKRDYYGCVLVDFKFRGIPQRISQRGDYSFGGRTEIIFRAYALNEDEIIKIKRELEKSDVYDALKIAEEATLESLEQIKEDIDYFLEEPQKKEEQKKKADENPFSALLGFYEKTEEKGKKSEGKKDNLDKPIRKDNFIESEYIRKIAVENSKKTTFTIFDLYKKAHGMPSYT